MPANLAREGNSFQQEKEISTTSTEQMEAGKPNSTSPTGYSIIRAMADDASIRDVTKAVSDHVLPYIERLAELYDSDRALAKEIGVEPATLSAILRRKQGSSFYVWLRVAQLTGMGFWLITGLEPMPEDSDKVRAEALAQAFLDGYSLAAIKCAREHVATHNDTPRNAEEWAALVDKYERGLLAGGRRRTPRW